MLSGSSDSAAKALIRTVALAHVDPGRCRRGGSDRSGVAGLSGGARAWRPGDDRWRQADRHPAAREPERQSAGRLLRGRHDRLPHHRSGADTESRRHRTCRGLSLQGQDYRPAESGAGAGARYVVHAGSVQRAGEHVRVNVRLVDVVTGFDILGEPFEGEVKDLFALQDRISRDDRQRAARSPDELVAAVSAVRRPTSKRTTPTCRGRHFVHLPSRDGAEARANLTRAIEFTAEPSAPIPTSRWRKPAGERVLSDGAFTMTRIARGSRRHLSRSKRLWPSIPDLAEALVARGMHTCDIANGFPMERAVRDFQHAIALNPSLIKARLELRQNLHAYRDARQGVPGELAGAACSIPATRRRWGVASHPTHLQSSVCDLPRTTESAVARGESV